MARHKQIKTEEQEDPEMNISSMIDCCFLLLIYFLVATSLVSEKKLDISIPASTQSQSSQKPPVEPGRIVLRADGSVTWNGDMNVAEVAVHCGYADSSAFIKQFRKYKGTTPKQYMLRMCGGAHL